MAAQRYVYPNPSVSVAITAIGTNGITAPLTSIQVAGQDVAGNLVPVLVASDGTVAVSATALPLPSGAATEAKQVDILNSTMNIEAITGSIDGKIVNVDTDNVTVVSQTGVYEQGVDATTLNVNLMGAEDPSTGFTTRLQTKTGTHLLAVSVTDSTLPTGAATASLQTTGNTSLSSIDTKTPALVTGRVPVDGSGVTQPISASALPLPSGASTSALQTTGNTSLASIDTKTPALGQAVSASSVPVVLASNQSALPTANNTDTTATGTLNGSGQTLEIVTNGASSVGVGLSGTSVSTLIFESTVDGTNWATMPYIADSSFALVAGGSITNISVTQAHINSVGVAKVRARISSYTSGSIVVTMVASQATRFIYALSQSTSNFIVQANQYDGAGFSITRGQKAMSGSMPVVLASDQASIPVAATPVVPAALTVKSAGITVGTSAVRLTTDGLAPSSTRRVLMANVDTANTSKFYIGPSGVTASNGVLLVAGQTFSAENDAGDYYIISNTAAQTVFVTEQE